MWGQPNQRIYFFKGAQYIRVDPANSWKVDPGYPKPIAGNWPGLPANFAAGIDAALWSPPNQKIYFFKGAEYVRVDPNNAWNVDPGYPKPIAGNWPGLAGRLRHGHRQCSLGGAEPAGLLLQGDPVRQGGSGERMGDGGRVSTLDQHQLDAVPGDVTV